MLCEQRNVAKRESLPCIDQTAKTIGEERDGGDDVADCASVDELWVVYEDVVDSGGLVGGYASTEARNSEAKYGTYVVFHAAVKSLDERSVLGCDLLDSEFDLEKEVFSGIKAGVLHVHPATGRRVETVPWNAILKKAGVVLLGAKVSVYKEQLGPKPFVCAP